MKYRIRRIDSRDYGNSFLLDHYEFMHVVEQEVWRRKYVLFGPLVPVWVRVASGISQQAAEEELRKIIDNFAGRRHAEPVTVKEIEIN